MVAFGATPEDARADWPSARGGSDRAAFAPGAAGLTVPQVSWRQPLGGQLGAGAMWSTALGTRPTLLIANGSRIQHKRWDDGLVWQGPLVGVDQILGLADLDLDGEPDMLLASGTAAGAVLVGLSLDGEFRWAPQPGQGSGGFRP